MKAIKKQQPHPPRLPPYHALPRMSLNVTNTLVVRGAYGMVWIKNEDGSWERYMTGRQTSEDYLKSLAQEAAGPNTDNSDDGESTGSYIGIMVGLVIGSAAGTILIGAIIALVVFGVRRVRAKRRTKNLASAYLVINEQTDTGGLTAHSHGSTASAAGNSNV